MLIGFSNVVQLYISWCAGLLLLFLIWIINLYEIDSNTNANTTNFFKKTISNLRWLVLIIFGFFISEFCIRLGSDQLIVTSQSLLQPTKLNSYAIWLFGIFIIFLVKVNRNSSEKSSKHLINIICTLCYLWQITHCVTHPILLLICLEINLLLFLMVCIHDTKITEGILTNILLLVWTGALASVLAFLALKIISPNQYLSALNLVWLGVFLFKFIVIPAQITLLGIYQRWSAYNLTVYIATYYIPLLCFLLPILMYVSMISSVGAVLMSCALILFAYIIITHFESTGSPSRTIVISSLITLILIIVSALLIS